MSKNPMEKPGGILFSRLLAYSATAGTALLSAGQASAEVVYVDLNPDVVRGYNSPFALDLDGDGIDDATFVIDQAATASYGYRSGYRRFNVELATSNSLLASAYSAPLGSNYRLDSLVGWAPGGGVQAFFSTAKSPGYPVDITQGGPLLGATNKFIGIRFQVDPAGADTTHYGWIRLSVGAQAQSFTISDYAYEDAPDTPVTTGVWLGVKATGTLGAVFEIEATAVDPLLVAFTSKPKVVGTYFDPSQGKKAKKASVGVLTKIAKGVPAPPTVACEWKKAIRLYSSKAFKAAYAAGSTAEDFLAISIGTNNVTMQVQAKDGAQAYRRDVWQYQIRPPSITGVTSLINHPVGQAGLGQYLKVNGDWFGKKAPKVWLEYLVGGTVKMAKLKVLNPLEFADAAGKPGASCMDPATGASVLVVQMPTAWPSGWQHGPHNMVLDNGIGIASFGFATAP